MLISTANSPQPPTIAEEDSFPIRLVELRPATTVSSKSQQVDLDCFAFSVHGHHPLSCLGDYRYSAFRKPSQLVKAPLDPGMPRRQESRLDFALGELNILLVVLLSP